LRTEDSRRLSKALFVSIIFHIFLFVGLNLFNWFSDVSSVENYSPLTVKIENNPVLKKTIINESEMDLQEPLPTSEASAIEPEPVAELKVKTPALVNSSPPVPEFDPYADIGTDNNSNSSLLDSEPLEDGVIKSTYVPKGENKIELESSNDETIDQSIPFVEESSKGIDSSVISDNEFQSLEKALDSDYLINDSPSTSETESKEFIYNDSPVQFDNPDAGRSMVSEPLITIPSRFSEVLSSDSTVVVSFLLNADGRMYLLKVKQSSGYSEVDNSIISELRKWEFDKAPGSDDLKGNVTILLKGK
jgi:TonB family protein